MELCIECHFEDFLNVNNVNDKVNTHLFDKVYITDIYTPVTFVFNLCVFQLTSLRSHR